MALRVEATFDLIGRRPFWPVSANQDEVEGRDHVRLDLWLFCWLVAAAGLLWLRFAPVDWLVLVFLSGVRLDLVLTRAPTESPHDT
jgi:hypothetical protein